MKRLLSYHAVSQVGYMVLGIGTGTPVGIAGGLFHMLNNAVYKSCLFLCAGSVEKQTQNTDLDRLGGLARRMPITFAACLVAALSISGIPPLNGFASKWMVYQGIVEAGKSQGGWWVLWLAAALLGSALTLASFLKLIHATYLCKPSPELAGKAIREAHPALWVPTAFLALLCVVFGVAAYRLPLPYLVQPAVPGSEAFLGVWSAGAASAMILAALAAGALLYALTVRGKLRRTPTYIGGERMEEAYLSHEAATPERHIEVTGVDFYRTVEQIGPLAAMYRAADRKLFDVYELGSKGLFYIVEFLRKAHTGVLPLYLTWFVIGLLAVLYLLLWAGAWNG
jgi:NADH:ubiquinone oxidoreductase subunit 5 (subunit L)/multisubunit Na+/H+ antiporter MnhA subunit